jgi:hypothetical protein
MYGNRDGGKMMNLMHIDSPGLNTKIYFTLREGNEKQFLLDSFGLAE